MKLFIAILFAATPSFAATWIQAPKGVLPTSVGETYESEELCGAECIDISAAADLEVSKIMGKKAVPDKAKFDARQSARAAAEAPKAAEREALKAVVRDLSKIADPETRKVVQALVQLLGADK